MIYLFPSFTSPSSILIFEVSFISSIVEFYDNFCLLIDILGLFTFNMIIDTLGLNFIILLFKFSFVSPVLYSFPSFSPLPSFGKSTTLYIFVIFTEI